MEVKSGLMTSEFWLTIFNAAFVVVANFVSPEMLEVAKTVTWSVMTYVGSRMGVKMMVRPK